MHKVHFLADGFPALGWQVYGDYFLLLFIELAPVTLAPEVARRCLKLISNDHDAAALILKRFGNRVEFRLNLSYALVLFGYVRLDLFLRRLCLLVELLVFGRVLYFSF